MKSLLLALITAAATATLCRSFPATAAPAAPLTDTQRAWAAKAHRHEKAGWLFLHVEGPARERGFQHGYLLAPEIGRALRAAGICWTRQSSMEWSWLAAKADTMFTPRIDPENLAEVDGIVEGLAAAGVPASRADLIAWNGIIELSGYWWPRYIGKLKAEVPPVKRAGCSSFIATGGATADGGVVLGHNTVGGYEGAPMNLVLDVAPEKGHRILMQSAAGWIHSGSDFFITDAGLVGSETTLGGFDGFDSTGVPEFSRMRRATQDAASIDEWCAIMRKGNNGGYANAWLLGDVNTREIARLELGLKYVGYEKKRDGWFSGSNVAEDLKILRLETETKDNDIRASNVARRIRWKQLLDQNVGRIDLEAGKRFEADHFDVYLGEEHLGSRGLCSHGEMDHSPAWPASTPNEPGGTFDGKVLDTALARRMSFAARWGAACGRAFDATAFLKANPQFEWMRDILDSRPSQPWVEFTAGETR
ncbi:MAG: phospholipase [Candidatus Eisenbacteria bacterium]|nr:phospholipase [Candidatus Eisenbacteria bacterium]